MINNLTFPAFDRKIVIESLCVPGLQTSCGASQNLTRRVLPLKKASSILELEEEKEEKMKQGNEEEDDESDGKLRGEMGNQELLITTNYAPDHRSIVGHLKDCTKQRDLHEGNNMHAKIVKLGYLGTSVFIGNALVSMYVKCGSLARAQEICFKLPVRNAISWNAIIAGCVKHGFVREALDCYKQMQLEDVSPNAFTMACILKACGNIGALDKGKHIHSEMLQEGLLDKDVVLGTALVDMYAKCGTLTTAQAVFDELPVRDVVLWNALIAGYAQHGQGDQALRCSEEMRVEGLMPNKVTFLCIINACCITETLEKGDEVYSEVVREGFVENDIALGNALVDMYARHGLIVEARHVFDTLPVQDIVSWNTLINGYLQHGCDEEVLNCFAILELEGHSPDAITLISILRACGNTGTSLTSMYLHATIIRYGLLEQDKVVGEVLLDMYVKLGLLSKAQLVFNKLPFQDVSSWSSLISGYAQHDHGEEALYCFKQMQQEGLSPSVAVYASALKACGSIKDAHWGEALHAEILVGGLLHSDHVVGTALLDMYAKCGLLEKAAEVFYNLSAWDMVSWCALIAGYTHNGWHEAALNCYELMQLEDLVPNMVTFSCILQACGSIGAVSKGKEIHAVIAREGLLADDAVIGNALIDMYAKCGLLGEAQEVFSNLQVQDVVSWNALIMGYTLFGKAENAFLLFSRMRSGGGKLDVVTFVMLMSICRHGGLLVEGEMCFEAMSVVCAIVPTLEIFTCLIDLFGRAGQLDSVVSVITEMPYSSNLTLWHTVLGACRKWGGLDLGRLVFELAVQFDKQYTSVYVCMGNMYVEAGN